MPKEGLTRHAAHKLLSLTIAGAAVFWAATVATSLLPLAAEYRAAYSNWKMETVWVDSWFAGLIFGCGVSYFLLRSLGKTPSKDPIRESAKLGCAALVLATLVIDVPRALSAGGPGNGLYYFLVGLTFNAARFLLLGIAIGYLYKTRYGSA